MKEVTEVNPKHLFRSHMRRQFCSASFVLLLLLLSVQTLSAARLFVNVQALGANNGTSWNDAFTDLQDALAAASAGDEIWVARGTYKPSTTTVQTHSFELVSGAALYGGFAGNESQLLARDVLANETVLSGMLDASTRSYHVVLGADDAVLDGFTITAGRARSTVRPHFMGAGIYNDQVSPIVRNCRFIGNDANFGAAVFNSGKSSTYINCLFMNNTANFGAGIYNSSMEATFTNCTWINNRATYGGAAYNTNSRLAMENIVLYQNSATQGAGFYNSTTAVSIIHCTAYGNSGSSGITLYNNNSDAEVVNSIFWNTSSFEIVNYSSSSQISFSDIKGSFTNGQWNTLYGLDAGDNFDDDPQFVSPDDISGPDGIAGTEDDGLFLNSTSPAVDTGSVTTVAFDISGRSRQSGTAPDIGAYEYVESVDNVLLGYWPLDGDATDLSGYHHDGVMQGATPVTGRINDALAFDGVDDVVIINDVASAGASDDLTVAAWIKINSSTIDRFMRIVSKKEAWDSVTGFELQYNPGRNYLSFLGANAAVAKAESINLDTGWHHVAAVVSGSNVVLYVDGNDRTTSPTIEPVQPNNIALTLGKQSGGTDFFAGAIDEVYIYSRALSANEIAEMANPESNQLPQAADDILVVDEDSVGQLNVIANDSDPDGDALTVIAVGNPQNGTCRIISQSEVEYVPNPDYFGADTFTYTISDGRDGTATAEVTVTVAPVNDAPEAQDVTYNTSKNTPLSAVLLATDIENDALMYVLESNGSLGTAVLDNPATGAFTYTPNTGAVGEDSFTFTATDNQSVSNLATVTVTIDSGTVVNPDLLGYWNFDEADGVQVLDSSGNENHGTITSATRATGISGGALYFDGVDDFVSVPDSASLALEQSLSISAWVKIQDPTLLRNMRIISKKFGWDDQNGFELQYNPGINYLSMLGAGIDIGKAEGAELSSDWHHVAAVFNGTTATLYVDGVQRTTDTTVSNATQGIQPLLIGRQGDNTNYFFGHIDEVRLYGRALSETEVVALSTANTENRAPVAAADVAVLDEDGTTEIYVLENDSDPDNDALTVAEVSQPSHGTCVLLENTSVRYTPNADFNGTDSFIYTITDGHGGTDSATVTVTVNPVPDAPIASDLQITVAPGQSVEGLLPAVDADDDSLTYQLGGNESQGTVLLLDAQTGTFEYTADAEANGSDSFTFTASDGALTSNTGTVSITIAAVTMDPIAAWNFDEEDGEIALDSSPNLNNGVIYGARRVGGMNGNALQFDGINDVVEVASDPVLTPATAMTIAVWIKINRTDLWKHMRIISRKSSWDSASGYDMQYNPDRKWLSIVGSGDSVAGINLDLDTNWHHIAAIIDGNNVTFYIDGAAQNAIGSVGSLLPNSQKLTIGRQAGGSDYFEGAIDEVRIYDRALNEGEIAALIAIQNALPVAVDDDFTTDEDSVAVFDLLQNDSDADDDPLTIIAVGSPQNGTCRIIAAAEVEYIPNANYFGSDSFTYTVSDGRGGSATAEVTVNVTAVNDAPEAQDAHFTTTVNSAFSGSLSATDIENDTLTYSFATTGTLGAAQLDDASTGAFTYTPNTGTTGEDTFTFTATDGQAVSNTATVTVVISDGTVTNPDLLGYWNFDEMDGDQALDSSDFENHGIITSATRTTGISGGALHFDGLDDFVTIPDSESFAIDGALSISAWIRIQNDQLMRNMRILSKKFGWDDTSGFELQYNPGSNYLSILGSGTDVGKAEDCIMDETWHHIVAVFNRTTATLYVDGVACTTDTTVSLPTRGSQPLLIGRQGDDTNYFLGAIDEVRLYNRVLTETEITALGVIDSQNLPPVAVDDSYTTAEDAPVIADILANDSDPDSDALTISDLGSPQNGTCRIVASSQVEYVPDPDYFGYDSFTYVISDGRGGSATAEVTVNVTAVNDAPEAQDDSFTTLKNNSLSALLSATDIENDALTYSLLSTGALGVAQLDDAQTGAFTYTPNTDITGEDSFTFTVTDGQDDSNTATVTIRITETTVTDPDLLGYWNFDEADGAQALDSSGNDNHGTVNSATRGIGINGNALHFDGLDDYVHIPDSASLAINSSLSISAWIKIEDTDLLRNMRIISKKFGWDDDSGFELQYNPGIDYLSILGSGTDIGKAEGCVLDGDWHHIAAVFDGTTAVLYVDGAVCTTDTSVSTATQGIQPLLIGRQGDGTNYFLGLIDEVRLYKRALSVAEIEALMLTDTNNSKPVAVDDHASVDEDAYVEIAVLDNDTDSDSDDLKVIQTTQPTNGSAVVIDNVVIRYTPNPDFNGTDNFNYTISDGKGGTASATVNITVNPVQDSPVAQNQQLQGYKDQAVEGILQAEDVDGDTLTFSISQHPAEGTVQLLNAETGSFVYTPEPAFTGETFFQFSVSDGNGNSDTGTVSISIDETPDLDLVAFWNFDEATGPAQDISTYENHADLHGATRVSGMNNQAIDFDGVDDYLEIAADPSLEPEVELTLMTWIKLTAPDTPRRMRIFFKKFSPLSISGFSLTYSSETEILSLNGGGIAEATGTISLTDEWQHVAAVVTDANVHFYINGNSITVSGSINRDFVNSEPLHIGRQSGGTDFLYGCLDNTRIYTRALTQSEISDIIIAESGAPVAVDDTLALDEDTSATVDVLANDRVPAAQSVFLESVTQPGSGFAEILVGTTDVRYTPSSDFNGTDSFTYTIINGNGDSSTATVYVSVAPVQDSPIAVDSSFNVIQDQQLNGNLLANDVDGDTLVYQVVTDPVNGILQLNTGTGAFTYTPNAGYTGTDSFTFQADDGISNSNIATITLNIQEENTAPVAADDSAELEEDSNIVINVLGNDTDADFDDLSVTEVTDPAYGTAVINGDFTVTYTPEPDYNGNDSFMYTISDGRGGTDQATVNIVVNPVPDAPIATDAVFVTNENTIIEDVLSASDADDDQLLFEILSNGTLGTAIVLDPATGEFRYTPDPDTTGTDSFTYSVSDGTASATATVTITISAPEDSLVAFWTFDENEGTQAQDYSGYGNNGVITNGALRVPGKSGNALSFDGIDDYIYVPDADSLDLGNVFSITAWFKVADPTLYSHMRIISKKQSWDASSGYDLQYNPERNWLSIMGNNTDLAGAVISPDTEWHHLAVVVNGATAIVYLDGNSVAVEGAIEPPSANSVPVVIGRAAGGASDHFKGLLDQIRLHKSALTEAEIVAIINEDNEVSTRDESTATMDTQTDDYTVSTRSLLTSAPESTITPHSWTLDIQLENSAYSAVEIGFRPEPAVVVQQDNVSPLSLQGSTEYPELKADYRVAETSRENWYLHIAPGDSTVLKWSSNEELSKAVLHIGQVGTDGLLQPDSELDMVAVNSLVVPQATEPLCYRVSYISTEATTEEIHLARGWNLISFKLHNESEPAEVLFANEEIKNVWTYDAAVADYVEPLHIECGRGYWIYSAQELVLQHQGKPAIDGTIRLVPGWNLVAPIESVPLPLNENLIPGIWTWDSSTQTQEQAELLEAGRAYWINAKTEAVLTLK